MFCFITNSVGADVYEPFLEPIDAEIKSNKQFLRPINLDSAYINTENKNEIRVGFDFLRDGNDDLVRANAYNLNLKYKRAFDTRIPTRASLGFGLEWFTREVDFDPSLNTNELDFGNTTIGLEAAPLNKEKVSLSLYFDQTLPTGSHIGILRGAGDMYSFHIGSRYQISILKRLKLFGDLAYSKAFALDDDSNLSSDIFSYVNELVLDVGSKVNPSLAFATNNIINSAFDSGDPYFIIPGAIIPFGKTDQFQTRIGLPIGLADSFYDIGVQASLFTIF